MALCIAQLPSHSFIHSNNWGIPVFGFPMRSNRDCGHTATAACPLLNQPSLVILVYASNQSLYIQISMLKTFSGTFDWIHELEIGIPLTSLIRSNVLKL